MSDSSTRGGRRPGAGRKPGHGTGPNPEIRERVPADLADYCKAQQATSPGFLARLIREHKENEMSNFAASYDRQSNPEDLNHYYDDKENEEVWVEDPETGSPLAQGLQGCRVCDEAVRAAKRIANDRGSMVILHDHDGSWEIEPA